MKTSVLAKLQRLAPRRLWLSSLMLSALLAEIVVSAMDMMLKGEITSDYLLTGLVASLLVAALVVALLNVLFAALQDSVTRCKRIAEELRRSEERARLAISVSHLSLWDYNLVTGSVYLSENWSALLGGELQPTFTTIHELTELVHEEERDKVRAAIVVAVKDQASSYHLTHRVRKLDGEYIWILSAGHVTERDQRGKALRMTGTNRDINESKQAGEKLRESEAQLRAILDNLPYLIWLKDTDGRYLKVNKSYVEYLRLANREQFTGKTDLDLWPKDLAEKYRADDAFVMTARQPIHIEETSLEGDRIRWVETFKTAIIDENDKVLGTTGFARDITERKQVETNLRIAATAFEAQEGILVTDADGVILRVNCAFTKITGYSAEEVIGKNPRILRSGRQDANFYTAMWESINRTGGWEGEIWNRCKNGEDYLELVTITAVKDTNSNTTHYVATFIDITKKKLAEQQLQELSARIQAAREEEKAHLAREIHDDLGGTLAALRLEVYMLTRDLSDGKSATQIQERIKNLSELLDGATFATRRVISELHPTILDALGLLAAIEWQAGQFNKRTGIECRVMSHKAACETELNKTQAIGLFRIFQESLTNVAKHSGASRVEVEFRHGCEVMLAIRDNGCGLPEGHTIASTSYGMRGMTERVEHLSGGIIFDSLPGEGLSVTVKLPAPCASFVKSSAAWFHPTSLDADQMRSAMN